MSDGNAGGPKEHRRSDERIRDDVNDRLADEDFVDASEAEGAYPYIADRNQPAELSRQYELKRSLNKGLGLGM
ncbi:hypothetical protein [Rhizobium sp. Root482]|uniref:hypothetical protein n=1 Tax=Rhizobium sp. Root482 TaxID=1736543 RepID=UPI0006FAC088|nr:hypothetical protein [Rhizobium sp. Root482]KQY22502.1 hypothetical protein ASD31_22655 [Rhizobium sp. Root482]